MPNPLFRESALQNLSSPEQLDQLIKITQPRAWIVLATIGFILVVAVLWSIFGSLPTTLTGEGIIIRAGGTFDIVALGNGVVADFGDFKTGDTIHKGDIIGHVAQPVLAQQIEAAQTELDRLEKANDSILAEIGEEKPVQNSSIKQEMDTQHATIAAKEEALRSHKLTLQQQESLLKDGLITRQNYEETRQAIFAAQNEIGTAHNALQNLSLQNISNNGTHEEKIRQSNASLSQARNHLEDLRAQYALTGNLVSPHDGIVVENLITLGDTVSMNQSVLSIESGVKHLQAMVYMPPMSEAKRIKPGMDVQVSLSTAKKERYGYLLGKVIAISKYPSTEQGMTAIINNHVLVKEMSKSGAPFAVQVDFVPDNTTRSGYQWSSQAGDQVDLSSGTSCKGSFTIEKQRPISLIIPLLKNMTGF